MNPAALETNLKDLRERRHADRQQRRVHRPEPAEGRLRREPARGRLARRVQGARDPAHLDDGRGAEGDRGHHDARGRALEELLRARADVVALRPPDRGHARLHRRRSSRSARRSSRRTRRAFKAGYHYGETTEDFVVSVRGAAGEARAGRLPQHHRQPGARVRPRSPRPSKSELPLFLGAYPITPASAILEELARHKNFGVRTFQAEDEIAAVGAALGASVRRRARRAARRPARGSC